MIFIIVSLLVGIILGIIGIIPNKFMKYNSIIQKAGIILLIFSMGMSIGNDSNLLLNIKALGLKGLVFSIFTVVFSILFLYLYSLIYYKDKKGN